MDQSDIKDILELLQTAHKDEDWLIVEEAIDILKEYVDDDSSLEDLD